MSLLAVTVVGRDAPGIIAAVTGVLADLGGNLEDSSMTLLHGHFAMTLVVAVDRQREDVAAALAPVTEPRGLVVSVGEVPNDAKPAVTGSHHVLRVHGGDRPGIVSALAAVVSEHGGNITDLTTRLTGDLYVLIAEVELPPNVNADQLGNALAAAADRLGVDVSFATADADVL